MHYEDRLVTQGARFGALGQDLVAELERLDRLRTSEGLHHRPSAQATPSVNSDGRAETFNRNWLRLIGERHFLCHRRIFRGLQRTESHEVVEPLLPGDCVGTIVLSGGITEHGKNSVIIWDE